MAGQWPRLSRSLGLRRITKPALAASIQPAADPSHTQLLETTIGPVRLGANDSVLARSPQGRISEGPASTRADKSPQIQIERVRESETGSARRDTGVEMMRQISLQVPPDLREMIKQQVLINVTVGIDKRGKVTTADVTSTKGEEAGQLTSEALKAARWFRFRPNRQGDKAVASQTVLTFVFDPEPVASADRPTEN
jgi:outer membrane biosynthesis protein TonB